jgi:hypothetical protein
MAKSRTAPEQHSKGRLWRRTTRHRGGNEEPRPERHGHGSGTESFDKARTRTVLRRTEMETHGKVLCNGARAWIREDMRSMGNQWRRYDRRRHCVGLNRGGMPTPSSVWQRQRRPMNRVAGQRAKGREETNQNQSREERHRKSDETPRHGVVKHGAERRGMDRPTPFIL